MSNADYTPALLAVDCWIVGQKPQPISDSERSCTFNNSPENWLDDGCKQIIHCLLELGAGDHVWQLVAYLLINRAIQYSKT